MGSVGSDFGSVEGSAEVPYVEVCAPPELLTDVLGLSSDPVSDGWSVGSLLGVGSAVVVPEPAFGSVSGEEGPAGPPSVASADATPWPVATAKPKKAATAKPLARRLCFIDATSFLLRPPDLSPPRVARERY